MKHFTFFISNLFFPTKEYESMKFYFSLISLSRENYTSTFFIFFTFANVKYNFLHSNGDVYLRRHFFVLDKRNVVILKSLKFYHLTTRSLSMALPHNILLHRVSFVIYTCDQSILLVRTLCRIIIIIIIICP